MRRDVFAAISLTAVLVLGCAGPPATAIKALPHFDDFAAAKEAAARGGGLVLLDFYTDW